MRREWPRAVDDVSGVPIDANSMRLVSGAKNIERLPACSVLKALWCFDIGSNSLDLICDCSSLESLYIKTNDLSAL